MFQKSFGFEKSNSTRSFTNNKIKIAIITFSKISSDTYLNLHIYFHLLVITWKGNQSSETNSQRVENLSGCICPGFDCHQFVPFWG